MDRDDVAMLSSGKFSRDHPPGRSPAPHSHPTHPAGSQVWRQQTDLLASALLLVLKEMDRCAQVFCKDLNYAYVCCVYHIDAS